MVYSATPTVEIVDPAQPGSFFTIAQSDYDPAIHTLRQAALAEPKAASKSKQKPAQKPAKSDQSASRSTNSTKPAAKSAQPIVDEAEDQKSKPVRSKAAPKSSSDV